MSNVDTPDVGSGEINVPDLLVQQSGIPNMSSTKTFTVDTNMRVNGDLDVTGTVTATSFIGDGSQLTGIVGDGVGLDSAGVTLLVDSDYVQARETPQDFAYSSLTGAPTALSSFTNDTNFVDSVGVISAVTSSDLDMGGNKVLFSNVYPTEADLPDATANHGMFAHVHATGAGYFAHAGSWVQLANDADIPVGGGGLEGFDVSQYDSATSNGIFEYNVSPGNQLRHLYSLNDAVSPTAYDGSLEHQVSWTISSNQQFGFRDAGGFRTKVNALANGSTATTGLVLEGETFNNSGVELVGNVKLSSLPTSDPSETGLLWNDGGIPVFSGSTAPTGGGGLDSAGVTALINEPYLRDTLYDVATAQTNIGLDAGFASTSNFSIAIGKESGINSGNATNSIALGFKAGQSISDNSIMIGRETGEVGAGSYSVGIGTEALGIGAGAGSVAIGYFASRSSAGSNSVAVGRQSSATGDNAIAIGNTVTATTADAVTIGSSVAGRMTYDTTNDWTFGATVNAPAFVGDGSGLTGLPSGGGLDSAGVQLLIDAEVDATTLVLGTGTTAGIRVGSGATASTLSGGGIAIGQNSTATGSQAIAIGINAEGDNNAVAIGISTETASSSVSIGRSAISRVQGVAVGMSTETASSATAIGYNAKAGNNTFGTGGFSVAVGKDAYSQYDHSMHINSAANLGTGPSAVGGIVIESTLGRLEYSAAADWVFNAGVTMTDLVASGATVVFNNLPTVDPVNAGQLWNDAGTMKISAG